MQSPPKEWLLFGAHFAALDYLRAKGDADRDTASEVVGHALANLKHGRIIWAGSATIGGLVLWAHIDKYLR